MKIVILSANHFSQFNLSPTDMIISITSPGFEHPRQGTGNIPRLNLHFHDVTEEFELNNGSTWHTMDDSQAKNIVDFFVENQSKCDRVIVHCEAGISRSPGVAIGLCRYFDIVNENEIRDKFPHFNITVSKRIWRVCQQKLIGHNQ